jgi:hypothetical protein
MTRKGAIVVKGNINTHPRSIVSFRGKRSDEESQMRTQPTTYWAKALKLFCLLLNPLKVGAIHIRNFDDSGL